MRGIFFRFTGALAACILLISGAHGTTIRVTASGVISSVNDPGSLLPFTGLVVGQTPVIIEFTYDDQTAGQAGQPGAMRYGNAIDQMQLTVGTQVDTPNAKNSGSTRIFLFDDYCSTVCQDTWSATFADGYPADIAMDSRYRFYGLNTEPSPPVTPLTSLDLVPFAWPSDWTDVQIAFELIEPGDESTVFAELRANVTNVVVTPVPAAAWLFGSSLGLLGWMRRRQSV